MITVVKSRTIFPTRKSGSHLLMALVLLFSLGAGSVAYSQITCKAEVNRTSVPLGEDVILTVSAEGSIDWSADFKLPSIAGVSIRTGGTNQSMTYVNGRSSTTISKTYYLHVERQKDFVIGSITVGSGNKTCQSSPINIKVTAADQTGGIPPASSGNRVLPPATKAPGSASSSGDEIFVTLEVDSDDVWVGQQVILSFKYWHRGQSWSSPSYRAPKTEGFWREDLGKERTYRQSYKGWTYNVTEIRYSLYPTRSGTLNIEPATLEFSGGNSFFFGSRRRSQKPKSFSTDPVTVNVKPLPLPRPAEFSGIAATQLELEAKVNRVEVPAGESVTYSIQMMTDGFLKGFAGLEVQAPDNCRLHDGTEQLNTKLGGGRQNGTQRLIGQYIQEKIIVPGNEGFLEIPGLEVSWFNVLTGKYKVTRARAQSLHVTAGRPGTAGSASSGFRRSEIERLGMDLAFIRQAPDDLAMWTPVPTTTPLYWVCILLPILGLTSWRIYLNKLSSERRNPANVRRRRALVTALAGLRKAEEISSNDIKMGAISRVISGYVADVLNRPVAAIGGHEVSDFCDRLNLANHGHNLELFLQNSDSARYGGENYLLDSSVADVTSWITELDAAFKKSETKKSGSLGDKLLPLFIIVCLGIAITSPALAANQQETPSGADPVRLLAEGNHAYTSGDISRANELYSQALAMGADDPILHYNLGNAFARQGQLGQAVVSYLRARRLSPLDKDVNGNLQWVRSQLKDLELQDSSLPLFIAQVVTIIGWLTLAQWSFVPLVLIWVLALELGLGWYREEFSNSLRRLLLATVALLLISSGVAGWRDYLEEVRDQAVIVVAEVPVHSGPADSYPILFEVHDGLTINLNEYRDGWVRMNLGGQWQGWVPANATEPVRLPRD